MSPAGWPRWAIVAVVLVVLGLPSTVGPAVAQSRGDIERQFQGWLETRIWPEAASRGVSRGTFERAVAGLALDWSLPDLTPPGATPGTSDEQWQAEFASPARYFSASRLQPLISIGRAMLGEWRQTLAAVERRTGVAKEIIVAIWGIESSFGRVAMPKPALPVLATQAFMGNRREIFVPELIAALIILEEGHISLSEFRSSVAGALGQPQFLPTKFLAHAVDHNGDGRRDIWGSVPDTLASIGHYLRQHGWQPGVLWGTEAALPETVSCALEGPEQGRPLGDWWDDGVLRFDGKGIPGLVDEIRYLMMPAGRAGPGFIVSRNFYVLKTYNESDLYALLVGHLADRLAGNGPIRGEWKTASGIRRGDIRQMQVRLVESGYDVGGVDGLVGFKTRTAIGLWQARNGLAPTCYPDRALIEALR